MNRCLCCYEPLGADEQVMHASCVHKFFGVHELPAFDYTLDHLGEMARQIIHDQTSLTGVQPKLSLHLREMEGSKRLTIVGLWGRYICKPQTPHFERLPEVEDLTMHLAEAVGIWTVPHTLMPMADGSFCYLTERIDRTETGDKVAMEDLCQLCERQTEHKYKSSYERVGKVISLYSAVPKMDLTAFFEVVLFSWLTGNNDMHLKNFSLYAPNGKDFRLSPAYDLLNAVLVNPADTEELALTLNGKKKKLKKADFQQAAQTVGLPPQLVDRLLKKYRRLLPSMQEWIARSFLSDPQKAAYAALLSQRLQRLEE